MVYLPPAMVINHLHPTQHAPATRPKAGLLPVLITGRSLQGGNDILALNAAFGKGKLQCFDDVFNFFRLAHVPSAASPRPPVIQIGGADNKSALPL